MNLIKKVSIVLLCLMIFSFCVPNVAHAIDMETVGGKLLSPILSLIVSIGDGAMTLLQKVVINMEDTIINLDTHASTWSKIIVGAVFLAVTAIAIAAIIASRRDCISNWIRSSKGSNSYCWNRSVDISNYY